MYCIYSDSEVVEEAGNFDHVYPLSLGGTNDFVVWADRDKNSIMGSQVDGAVVNDPLVEFALRDSGVKGHGKNAREPRWKKTTMEDGSPVQVTFGSEEITVWNARDRREMNEAEVLGEQFTSKVKIGKHTALRFLAKAALGGGYFLYKDAFRNGAKCDELRELVFLDIEKIKQQGTLNNSGITVCDRFHPDGLAGGSAQAQMYRALCEGLSRSIFIAVPHHESISFHVGVVGVYIGSIVVPANTAALPNDGDHDVGHAMILAPGKTERLSLRALAQDFYENVNSADTSPKAPNM